MAGEAGLDSAPAKRYSNAPVLKIEQESSIRGKIVQDPNGTFLTGYTHAHEHEARTWALSRPVKSAVS
jgi:hypothetical protein